LTTMISVVEMVEVRKHYRLGNTWIEALKGISLQIQTGEFLCVAGPSGSGKTTLLNMIGCMDNPSSGKVMIDGKEVDRLSDSELTNYRRDKIGFIFQSFNLIPVLNVFENIEFPLLLKKTFSRKEREKIVMHFLEEVELSDRLRNKPGELSGGQRQRVAIARALVTRPLVVLADEPTANLDSETGQKIVTLMRRVNDFEKTTFILSTHDSQVMEHARRIVRIHDGVIIALEERA
jgi:putative ABC transport system ATP-binding protein